MGHRFRNTPYTPPRDRGKPIPYTALVFVAYGVVTPLLAAAAALVYQQLGWGALLLKRQFERPLPAAPSWRNLLFGAGVPELALAGGVVGVLLWRRLWRGEDPTIAAGLLCGGLIGMLYGLLVIPFGLFGLYLRTGPSDVPALVQPFFALLVALAGSVYLLALPWIWLTALVLGAVLGCLTAPVMMWVKRRWRE